MNATKTMTIAKLLWEEENARENIYLKKFLLARVGLQQTLQSWAML